tara:strand:+ start:463 stop:732 length:270 start_codon:yes stop_codon:yes gene_type:complete
MLNVKFEAMRKKILEILKEGKKYGYNNEAIAYELLILHSVLLSETLEEAENKATEIDDGKSDHSLGESQGFESGANWVIERIKDKIHSA